MAAPQWLYLSIVALISFVITKDKFKSFLEIKKTAISFYLIFIALAVISFSYTNNVTISLMDLGRLLTNLTLIYIFYIRFKRSKVTFFNIALIVSVFLIVESIVSLRSLIIQIYYYGMNFSGVQSVNVDVFKGFAGNRNITTASIICKVPFLLYLILSSKKILIKIALSLLMIIPILVLFLIGSRTALLSLSVITISLLAYSLMQLIKLKNNAYIINFLALIGIIGIAYLLSNYFTPSNTTAIERLSTIKATNEASSNRFILWSDALDYIKEHPVVGCGIGNWKVESSKYWSSNIGDNYLVPYHAHNDFLEITTELGIIGGLYYLLLFVSLFLFLFKSLILLKSTKGAVYFTLFASLTAYFIDSFFNFPFERPIMQVTFILLVSYISSLMNQSKKEKS